MFHEYAVDPSLLCSFRDLRYYLEKFSWAQGRLLARYPKRWKKLVMDACQGCRDIELKRIEEELVTLDGRMVRRPDSSWDPSLSGAQSWLENARLEHQRLPFKGILATANPHGEDFVWIGADLSEAQQPQFRSPGKLVPRTAEELASAVALLLQSSERVALIDPYFDPTKKRFRNTLRSFVGTATTSRRSGATVRVELHTSIERWLDRDRTEDQITCAGRNLELEIRKWIPGLLPSDCSLGVYIWYQRRGGEKIHNRYVLTNLWGVAFLVGLDEADDPSSQETEDVQRLFEDQYQRRFEHYLGDTPAFCLAVPLFVVGTNATEK